MADTKELRKFKKGIRLGALSSPPDNAEKGAMYIDNSGKLFIHNGTDFEEVVDKTTAQTLTNKSIDLTDNTLTGTKAEFDTALSDGDFTTLDGTETLSNKTFSDPITLDHETTPSNPASGKVKVYAKNDNKLHILNSDGSEAPIGSGGGGLDTFFTDDFSSTNLTLITDNDTEDSTISYDTTITDRTVKIDIDTMFFLEGVQFGSGTTTMIPISERQKGKTCSFSCYYKTSGNFTEGTIKFFIMGDIPGVYHRYLYRAVLPAAPSIKKLVVTFPIQDDVTGISYGFQATTTISSYFANQCVINFTDVEISQDPFVQADLGTITEWQSYDATLNNTQGVISTYPESKYRRVGDSIEVKFNVKYEGTGHSSDFSLSLPSGMKFNDAKLPDNNYPGTGYMGTAVIYDYDVSNGYSDIAIMRGNQTTIKLAGEYVSSAVAGEVQSSGIISSANFSNNDYISGTFTAPIEGWTSTNTHIVTPNESVQPVKYSSNSGQSIPDTTVTVVNFEDKIYDDENTVTTGSNWEWECPQDGYYHITAQVTYGPGYVGVTYNPIIYLKKKLVGGSYTDEALFEGYKTDARSEEITLPLSYSMKLDKGTKLQVATHHDGGQAYPLTNSQNRNWFSIHKIHHKPTLSAIPYTKWQTKKGSGTVTSDGEVSAYNFDNLSKNTTYRVSGTVLLQEADDSDNNLYFNIKKHGHDTASMDDIQKIRFDSSVDSQSASGKQSISFSFLWNSSGYTKLRFYIQDLTGDDSTPSNHDHIDLDPEYSWITVEELPMHKGVSIW